MSESFRSEIFKNLSFDNQIKDPKMRGEINGYIKKRLSNHNTQRTEDVPSLAEDLTQQVYEKALKYRDSFRAESKINTWMIGIAKNEIRTYFRNKAVREKTENGFVEEEVLVDYAGSQEEAMNAGVFLSEVAVAAQALSPEKRQTLANVALGNTYKEIASMDGETAGENGLKVRTMRARRELSEILADPKKEDEK